MCKEAPEDFSDDIEHLILRISRNDQDSSVYTVEESPYIYDNFFLGKRPIPGGVLNLGNIPALPESAFIMYIPRVYSLVDLLFRLNRKVRRINDLLSAVGWAKDAGNIAVDQVGYAGGIGTANPEQTIIPDPPDFDPNDLPDTLLELIVTPAGKIGFRGSDVFWDSFCIQCSPYFSELTGFPEILMFSDNQFGIEHGTIEHFESIFSDGNLFFENTENDEEVLEILSTKSLYQTAEERLEILLKSDLPVGLERQIVGGTESIRTILAHFDLKHATQYTTTRAINNFLLTDDWDIKGNTVCGLQIMDSPLQTGHVFNCRPSTIPSLNFFAWLRRRVYDFQKKEYTTQEIPLLQNREDILNISLIFALQK
jgi:hypothetical protein